MFSTCWFGDARAMFVRESAVQMLTFALRVLRRVRLPATKLQFHEVVVPVIGEVPELFAKGVIVRVVREDREEVDDAACQRVLPWSLAGVLGYLSFFEPSGV